MIPNLPPQMRYLLTTAQPLAAAKLPALKTLLETTRYAGKPAAQQVGLLNAVQTVPNPETSAPSIPVTALPQGKVLATSNLLDARLILAQGQGATFPETIINIVTRLLPKVALQASLDMTNPASKPMLDALVAAQLLSPAEEIELTMMPDPNWTATVTVIDAETIIGKAGAALEQSDVMAALAS